MRSLVILALLASCGTPVGAEVGQDACAAHGANVLPTSRNRTYGAETPVASADLDDIQDCIVGAKHPELPIPIHANGFIFEAGGAPALAGPYQTPGAGGTTWVASVPVPAGDRITRLHAAYKRSTGAGDYTVSLFKVSATGVGATLATYTDNVHDGANENHEIPAINYTAIVDEYYFLSVSIGDNAGPGRHIGVMVFADKL